MGTIAPEHPSTAVTGQHAPLDIAVIIGSVRDGRFGPTVAEWVFRQLVERPGLHVELLDPATDDAARQTEVLTRADGFVVVTPEYNHSFPASLKHLIDAHRRPWFAKPVAFAAYGGISGGLRAVEQLRLVFAELHAQTVRDTVSFHGAGTRFDEHGAPHDLEEVRAATDVMVDSLVWWAEALRTARGNSSYPA